MRLCYVDRTNDADKAIVMDLDSAPVLSSSISSGCAFAMDPTISTMDPTISDPTISTMDPTMSNVDPCMTAMDPTMSNMAAASSAAPRPTRHITANQLVQPSIIGAHIWPSAFVLAEWLWLRRDEVDASAVVEVCFDSIAVC